MKNEAGIREQEHETLAEAVDRARASYAAGGGVEHRVVAQWLLTWGEPRRVPFKEWLTAWNG
jgi:hypothetical protein